MRILEYLAALCEGLAFKHGVCGMGFDPGLVWARGAGGRLGMLWSLDSSTRQAPRTSCLTLRRGYADTIESYAILYVLSWQQPLTVDDLSGFKGSKRTIGNMRFIDSQ